MSAATFARRRQRPSLARRRGRVGEPLSLSSAGRWRCSGSHEKKVNLGEVFPHLCIFDGTVTAEVLVEVGISRLSSLGPRGRRQGERRLKLPASYPTMRQLSLDFCGRYVFAKSALVGARGRSR